MGKGDIKTKKGKIARGSFGNTRPRKAVAVAAAPVAKAEKEAKPKKAKK